MDLVWKAVNYIRSSSFDAMAKRVHEVDRPFAYNHFENIHIISTKTGLIKTLRTYYDKNGFFKDSGYTLEHSMALSFIVPLTEYLDNPEVGIVRKAFSRLEKNNFFDLKLPCRQVLKNIWICKPDNENRGRGIEIVNNWKEFIDLASSKSK